MTEPTKPDPTEAETVAFDPAVGDDPFAPDVPDPFAPVEPATAETATVKVIRCHKCKAPVETAMVTHGDQLCARCFSLLVNQVGVPLAPSGQTARISFQLRAHPSQVAQHERNLPELVEDAIATAARDFGRELRSAFFAGDAKLFSLLAQAKEHGLVLLVVVQSGLGVGKAPTTSTPVDLRRVKKAP